MSRHSAPRARRNPLLPVILTLAVGATAALLWQWDRPATPSDVSASTIAPSETSSEPPTAAPQIVLEPDALPAEPGAGPCTEVRVLSSLENSDLLATLATGYQGERRNIAGRCVAVTVTAQRSGLALEQARQDFASLDPAARPTVWAPDATAWLALAQRSASGERPAVPAVAEPIGYTPVVVAMPAAQAEALGWTQTPPSWADYLRTVQQPDLWAARGRPQWGSFKLGKTSPQMATSGLFGLVAAYSALASGGDIGSLDAEQVASTAVGDAVHASESATVHYGSVEAHFLWHARQAEDSGAVTNFLSAVTVQEKSVFDYNRGVTSADGLAETEAEPPANPLVPVYPRDGTFIADHPVAVLDAPWVDAATRAAAGDFIRYARSAEGQRAVRAAGYRDLNLQADPTPTRVGRFGAGTAIRRIAPPSAEVMAAVQDSFISVRKRARVLFAVDLSGSMLVRLPDGRTRIQAAQQAITSSLRFFSDDDDVGLAGFSNRRGSAAIEPGIVDPVTPLGPKRGAFPAVVDGLRVLDQTPLYDAVPAFAAEVRREYRDNEINAVVVLSDGRNDTGLPGTFESLVGQLGAHHEHQPVRVFTLAYGADADRPLLEEIARLTGAHFYDASDPTQLDAVLSDLVTNF